MKWLLVAGGVAAVGWLLLNWSPPMTSECRTLVEKTKRDNSTLRHDLDLAQRGLLPAQAIRLLEPRQAEIKDNINFIEKHCQRRSV
jgi:hypothetical protein